jgi:predicted AAA+ superfamily ATPase
MAETEGNAFKRAVFEVLIGRLREPWRFIQVLAGPRQTGKTTVARQVLAKLSMPSHYATADEPMLRDREWLSREWEIAREKAKGRGGVFEGDQRGRSLLASHARLRRGC